MDNASGRRILDKYLPAGTSELVVSWLTGQRVHLKFNRGRTTKLGDYRPPLQSPSHRITVNNDLNPYALLLTLVHEIAHMRTWVEHGRRVKPHGREWKAIYCDLLKQLVETCDLPEDIKEGFSEYSERIKASGVSDKQLVMLLRKYDPPQAGVLLEELPEGTVFRTGNGRTFKKKEKLRKRYRCELIPSGRIYLFSPLAVVDPLAKTLE